VISCIVDPREASGSGVDETSFEYLFKKETLVDIISFSSADNRLKVLDVIPVTPMLCYPIGTGNCLSTPAFAGITSQFWRGTIEFNIYAACSAMHSGVLLIYWTNVAPTVGSTLSADPTHLAYSCILDVAASTSRKISIGWNDYRVTKNCRTRIVSDLTLPNTELNGYLVFAVQSPLINSSGSSTIYISVTMNGGQDLIFGVPRGMVNNNSFYLDQILQVQAPSRLVPGSEEDICVLSTTTKVPNLGAISFGEVVTSFRALAQKFSAYGSGILNITSITGVTTDNVITVQFPFYPIPAVTTGGACFWNGYYSKFVNAANGTTAGFGVCDDTTYCFNWVGWIRQSYVGVRGGILVKCFKIDGIDPLCVVPLACSGSTSLQVLATNTTNSTFADYPMSIPGGFEKITGDYAAEYYFPYSSRNRFYPGTGDWSNSSAQNKTFALSFFFNHPTGTTSRIGMLYAGASDINFIRFSMTPVIATAGAALAAELGDGTFEISMPQATGTTSEEANIATPGVESQFSLRDDVL